jgi:hypothetical protein
MAQHRDVPIGIWRRAPIATETSPILNAGVPGAVRITHMRVARNQVLAIPGSA